MFRLDMSATFWAPVRFEVPAADGGARLVHEFQAEFPRMSTDDLEAFGQRAVAERLTDRQVAAALLRSWRDVADADGNALEFSPAAMARVFNVAGVAAAVVAAFRAAQPRAALGN